MGLVTYFVLSVIFVYLVNFYFRNPSPGQQAVLRVLSPRWLALLPLGILLEIGRRYYDCLYIFSVHQVTKIEGRLSLRYNVPSVKYADVKGVVVHQSFWGRLLDFGAINLGTAAQEGDEMVIDGVLSPYELAEFIDKLRSYNLGVDTKLGHRD
jgi:hypothetical protein